MEWLWYIILPFVITVFATPFVMWVAKYIDAYAKINARTIHTRTNIARIGGVAIYIGFMISMTCFMKFDLQIRALILGSSIMFFGGLIDDLENLAPTTLSQKEKIVECLIMAPILLPFIISPKTVLFSKSEI